MGGAVGVQREGKWEGPWRAVGGEIGGAVRVQREGNWEGLGGEAVGREMEGGRGRENGGGHGSTVGGGMGGIGEGPWVCNGRGRGRVLARSVWV